LSQSSSGKTCACAARPCNVAHNLPTTILASSNAGGAAWPVNQATTVELLSLNHPPADMCTACFFDRAPCRTVFGSLLNPSPAQIGDMGLSSLTKGEDAIKGKKMQVRTYPRLSMREWLLMPALGRFGLYSLLKRCWLAPLPAGHLAMDGA
jgi:hypothetical protein